MKESLLKELDEVHRLQSSSDVQDLQSSSESEFYEEEPIIPVYTRLQQVNLPPALGPNYPPFDVADQNFTLQAIERFEEENHRRKPPMSSDVHCIQSSSAPVEAPALGPNFPPLDLVLPDPNLTLQLERLQEENRQLRQALQLSKGNVFPKVIVSFAVHLSLFMQHYTRNKMLH